MCYQLFLNNARTAVCSKHIFHHITIPRIHTFIHIVSIIKKLEKYEKESKNMFAIDLKSIMNQLCENVCLGSGV